MQVALCTQQGQNGVKNSIAKIMWIPVKFKHFLVFWSQFMILFCTSSKVFFFSRSKSGSPVKSLRKEKVRSEEPEEEDVVAELQCSSDENLCIALSQQVNSGIEEQF